LEHQRLKLEDQQLEKEFKEAEANIERLKNLAKRLNLMILLLKLVKFVAALLAIHLVVLIFLQLGQAALIIVGTLLMSWACLNWLLQRTLSGGLVCWVSLSSLFKKQ
jgi:hypothetical protein